MKKKSRSKKFALNFTFEILLEIVTAICGFIVPHLILSSFGSAYNGIIQSITQFIGCIAILKSGIGSVMRAALYKPLAESNYVEVSKVVKATEKFMRKIALIFIVFVLLFACIYPLLVKDEFGWLFSSSLVIIISLSTFAQYFFGLTYQMLIQADQSNYIISIVQIICIILNTIFSYVLIKLGFSIHIVKLATASIYILQPIFYMLYSRKKYNIIKDVLPTTSLISQRWDAFGHQLASFINSNTDIIVATIFLGVKEVSVYSILYMIANAVKKIIMAVSTSITGAFGNMYAKNEKKLLHKRFTQYEAFIYSFSSLLFSVTYVLFVPFLSIYTKGITDVNYIRIDLIAIICLSEFFACIKLPYQMIIYICGDFKNTKYYAYIEAAINIGISLALVKILGLIGIVIGTTIAAVFQTITFSIYMSKHNLERSNAKMLKSIFMSFCICSLTILITNMFDINAYSYVDWFVNAILIITISFVVFVISLLIFYYSDVKDFMKFLLNKLFGRRNHSEQC